MEKINDRDRLGENICNLYIWEKDSCPHYKKNYKSIKKGK